MKMEPDVLIGLHTLIPKDYLYVRHICKGFIMGKKCLKSKKDMLS